MTLSMLGVAQDNRTRRRVLWSVSAGALALCAAPPSSAGDGDALTVAYGTFIGSTSLDEAEAVVFRDHSIYLAGHTQGLEFPAGETARTANRQHVVNAFVARLDLSGEGADFVTVFQGSDLADGEESIFALALDAAGNVYVAGNTNSDDFPVTDGAYQTEYGGNIDAFVAKLSPDGTIVYSTFLGGGEFDTANGLAVDSAGNAYVAGGTWSTDFPTTDDAYEKSHQGERDAFIARLAPDGATLEYASYLGGTSQEQAEAIALGPGGVVHVTGWTRSTDLRRPVSWTGLLAPVVLSSPFDAFVARLDLSGASADYVVALGGGDEDRGYAIAVDAAGRAIVGGRTASFDFPTTAGSFGEDHGGGICSFAPCPDAFVTKLTVDGAGLVYSGLLGGGLWDEGNALIRDGEGGVYVAGMTQSDDFPVTAGAYDATLDGSNDAFVARIDAAGETVVYATYLGGEEEDVANAAWSEVGGVYVGGMTRSSDFPITPDAFATELAGDYDAFAVRLADVPTGLTLGDTDPGIAGGPNSWDLSGASANGLALLLAGGQNGSTPVPIPACPGLTVEINNARIVSSITADAGGSGTFTRALPGALSGRTIAFQAVDRDSCSVSNKIVTTFQ